MDIENENNSNKNNYEASSLFAINYNKFEGKYKSQNEKDTPIDINISTGLPDTFKIEALKNETNMKENDAINMKKEIDNIEIKCESNKDIDFKSKEYEEINKENEKKIEQMSKEEILEAQKEILASIPSDLLEKFKSNFYTQQIKKSLHEKEKNNLKEIKVEENKITENNIFNKNNDNINFNFQIISYCNCC